MSGRLSNSRVKLPSGSVNAPIVVPLRTIPAPAIGTLSSSMTTPVTTTLSVWAQSEVKEIKHPSRATINFFTISFVYSLYNIVCVRRSFTPFRMTGLLVQDDRVLSCCLTQILHSVQDDKAMSWMTGVSF